MAISLVAVAGWTLLPTKDRSGVECSVNTNIRQQISWFCLSFLLLGHEKTNVWANRDQEMNQKYVKSRFQEEQRSKPIPGVRYQFLLWLQKLNWENKATKVLTLKNNSFCPFSSFIAITPKSSLIRSDSTCLGLICWSNRSVRKLIVFNWNNWYHTTVNNLY